jgi:hypothetical protein
MIFSERYMENVSPKLSSHLKDTFTEDEFYDSCQMNAKRFISIGVAVVWK